MSGTTIKLRRAHDSSDGNTYNLLDAEPLVSYNETLAGPGPQQGKTVPTGWLHIGDGTDAGGRTIPAGNDGLVYTDMAAQMAIAANRSIVDDITPTLKNCDFGIGSNTDLALNYSAMDGKDIYIMKQEIATLNNEMSAIMQLLASLQAQIAALTLPVAPIQNGGTYLLSVSTSQTFPLPETNAPGANTFTFTVRNDGNGGSMPWAFTVSPSDATGTGQIISTFSKTSDTTTPSTVTVTFNDNTGANTTARGCVLNFTSSEITGVSTATTLSINQLGAYTSSAQTTSTTLWNRGMWAVYSNGSDATSLPVTLSLDPTYLKGMNVTVNNDPSGPSWNMVINGRIGGIELYKPAGSPLATVSAPYLDVGASPSDIYYYLVFGSNSSTDIPTFRLAGPTTDYASAEANIAAFLDNTSLTNDANINSTNYIVTHRIPVTIGPEFHTVFVGPYTQDSTAVQLIPYIATLSSDTSGTTHQFGRLDNNINNILSPSLDYVSKTITYPSAYLAANNVSIDFTISGIKHNLLGPQTVTYPKVTHSMTDASSSTLVSLNSDLGLYVSNLGLSSVKITCHNYVVAVDQIAISMYIYRN